MRTDSTRPVALFLFAHQDDEFGVYAQIQRELRSGHRVCCAYVTDGGATAVPKIRDAESLSVLNILGVPLADVLFIGSQLSIADGQLHRHVVTLAAWLSQYIDNCPALVRCFVPAWEGGHPDHDLLHAIAVHTLASRMASVELWQYPLYNARRCPRPFFRLMSPLPENGPVVRLRINWCDRIRFVRLCLSYRSQWRTWIGLFPLACIHYFCKGVQILQAVDPTRLSHPPHAGPLYYERRNFLDWPTLSQAVDRLKTRETQRSNANKSSLR